VICVCSEYFHYDILTLLQLVCWLYRSSEDLMSALHILTSSVHGEPLVVIVNRRSVMKSVAIAMAKPDFSFSRPLRVTFAGEDAEDEGGPKREFFR
jgi:hypothetical protein